MRYATKLLLLSGAATMMTAMPARAQVDLGAHVVRASEAFGGTSGVGARLRLGVPLFPLEAALNAEYFFPACPGGECALSGATLDLNYTLPLPVFQPWLGAGWSLRWVEEDGQSRTEARPNVGAGAALRMAGVPISPYFDVRYELARASDDQVVMRVGVMFR